MSIKSMMLGGACAVLMMGAASAQEGTQDDGNAIDRVLGTVTVTATKKTDVENVQDVPVSVTALEYRLLSYLMLQRDRVVPPTELLEHLYGDDDAREANALEAILTRLRKKLGAGVVGTRRGFGYFLEAAEGLW